MEWVKLFAEVATALGTLGIAVYTIRLAGATNALVVATNAMVKEATAEARRSAGLQLFALQVQEFQSVGMRHLRREFASSLLMHHERTDATPDHPTGVIGDETVLEFFENLAQLTKLGVLNREVTWNYFSVAVQCYWQAARDLVVEMRRQEHDEALYSDVEWLSDVFAKQGPDGAILDKSDIPTRMRWMNYLKAEIRLVKVKE